MLAPLIVPTAASTAAGQLGLLRPGLSCFVASARSGYANRPKTGNWRYGDLHPARLSALSAAPITPLHHYYQAVRPWSAHRYFRPRGFGRLCLVWASVKRVSERSLFLCFLHRFLCSTWKSRFFAPTPQYCKAGARRGCQGWPAHQPFHVLWPLPGHALTAPSTAAHSIRLG